MLWKQQEAAGGIGFKLAGVYVPRDASGTGARGGRRSDLGKQVPLQGILSSVLLLYLVFRVRQQRLADPLQFEQLTDYFCCKNQRRLCTGRGLPPCVLNAPSLSLSLPGKT